MSKAKRHNMLGNLFQKMCGIYMIALGVILPYIYGDGDATALFITVPLGLYLLFTKQAIMYQKRKTRRHNYYEYYNRYSA